MLFTERLPLVISNDTTNPPEETKTLLRWKVQIQRRLENSLSFNY